MDRAGCWGIQTAQDFVEILRTTLLHPLTQAMPQLFRPHRSGKQPFQQRAQVKSRPAHHDGKVMAGMNLMPRLPRPPRIVAGGKKIPVRSGGNEMKREWS